MVPSKLQLPLSTAIDLPIMDLSSALVANTHTGLLVALAFLGFVTASRKVISYVRLLLSLFVLGGKNVSYSKFQPADRKLISCLAANLRQKRNMGSHHRSLRWNRQRICHPTRPKRLQPRPRLPHRIEAPDARPRNRTKICWNIRPVQDPPHGFL